MINIIPCALNEDLIYAEQLNDGYMMQLFGYVKNNNNILIKFNGEIYMSNVYRLFCTIVIQIVNINALTSYRDQINDILFPRICTRLDTIKFATNTFMKFMIMREIMQRDCLYMIVSLIADRRLYLDLDNI